MAAGVFGALLVGAGWFSFMHGCEWAGDDSLSGVPSDRALLGMAMISCVAPAACTLAVVLFVETIRRVWGGR